MVVMIIEKLESLFIKIVTRILLRVARRSAVSSAKFRDLGRARSDRVVSKDLPNNFSSGETFKGPVFHSTITQVSVQTL
jgi:hypothetical protein